MSLTFLFYIPNSVERGHRGDNTADGWGTLQYATELARSAEAHGWQGALIGTGWARPDTFTVATAVAAQTTTFKPLAAIRPGYWQPSQFANASATLDHLTDGRLLINIVSGGDNLGAYGDDLNVSGRRYDRTLEFMRLVRRLWTEEGVDFDGEYYHVRGATLSVRPFRVESGVLPPLYFGGASAAAERVAAAEADVQLFWGEPLAGVAERIDRLRALSAEVGRERPPLEFGLRVTTLVRDTTEEAWHDARAKVAALAAGRGGTVQPKAVGQQRLLDLTDRGEVLDSCLYTTPGKYGGGGAATTWLVGSADDVAEALCGYQSLGVTHFVLSDTPYKSEIVRLGDDLLPRVTSLVASMGNPAALHG